MQLIVVQGARKEKHLDSFKLLKKQLKGVQMLKKQLKRF